MSSYNIRLEKKLFCNYKYKNNFIQINTKLILLLK